MVQNCFFLWVGSPLPEIARVCVLSAVDAGFDTVLFTDRPQNIHQPNLRLTDWREISLPWLPEEVRLKGRQSPYYAGFANLFRYALLAENDGWWFDCDTLILRPHVDFADILSPNKVVVGKEDDRVINNAVIGSCNKQAMSEILSRAKLHYPVFSEWGKTGPKLMSSFVSSNNELFVVKPAETFYPVHHGDVARLYLPGSCAELKEREHGWHSISLWSEVLSRTGLAYLQPPPGSYLADYLARYPQLGQLRGSSEKLAIFLAENNEKLQGLDSGRLALRTLRKKVSQRLRRYTGFGC